MQFEHLHYAEIRSIKKLGHSTENDETEMQIDLEREQREDLRRSLMQQLAKLEKQEKSDLELKAKLVDQLETMRKQDEQKLAQYRLVMQEGNQVTNKIQKVGGLTRETS